MIKFHEPTCVRSYDRIIHLDAALKRSLSGYGDASRACEKLVKNWTQSAIVRIVTSCTHALEIAALLLDIKPGDEVIMPSFTFPSTATAFVLRGAKLVFVDIVPMTMNMSIDAALDAITDKTKAIVPVHYAGNACDMMHLMRDATVPVVEDAAQCMGSTLHGQPLGTFGLFGCYSFHSTKNVQCGEGGAIVTDDRACIDRLDAIINKGTDYEFYRVGQKQEYQWVDIGSSYVNSELNSTFLKDQLEELDMITSRRKTNLRSYYEYLKPLSEKYGFGLQQVTDGCSSNGHIAFIHARSSDERTKLMNFLQENDIQTATHYVPLHTSPAGLKYGRFHGTDVYTTCMSRSLVRLPIHNNLCHNDIVQICERIGDFYARS